MMLRGILKAELKNLFPQLSFIFSLDYKYLSNNKCVFYWKRRFSEGFAGNNESKITLN